MTRVEYGAPDVAPPGAATATIGAPEGGLQPLGWNKTDIWDATAGDRRIFRVNAITDVNATALGLVGDEIIIALGRDTASDGGGGLFLYVAASVQPVDGGFVFAPTVGPGRLFRNGWTVFGVTVPVYPEFFGANTTPGTTDMTAVLQAAEEWASDLYVATGREVTLTMNGNYAITDSIVKQPGVHWIGNGKIRRKDNAAPTGTQWALVLADEVDYWSIKGLSFETIAQDVLDAAALPRKNGNSRDPGCWNSCIDAYKCQFWEVSDCDFFKFSQGIKYTGSGNFAIAGVNTFTAGTAYTVADVLAGTPQTFSFASTGAIVYGLDQTLAPIRPLGRFTITGARISAPGLDAGIEVMINNFGQSPGITMGNTIEGSHSGIILYQGSVTDDGNAVTYQAAAIVNANHIYATWEQGIYIRGTFGIQVFGNYIERAAQINTDPNSSAGAIIVRVNPFDPTVAATYVSAANGDVSDDHATLIFGNRCVNTGRNGVSAPVAAVYVRTDNVRVYDNDIVQAAEAFTTASIPAVLVSNGGYLKNFYVCRNRVSGPFTYGVQVVDVVRSCDPSTHFGKIDENEFSLTGATRAIDILWRAFSVSVCGNRIVAPSAIGVRVGFAPYSTVSRNKFYDCATGIDLSEGTLASDYAFLVSGGVATRAIKRGGSITVLENDFYNVTTPHAVSSTGTGDAFFAGRCAQWARDKINGLTYYPHAYSGGTPPTTFTAQTWNKYDETQNTAAAAGQTPGRFCTSPGTYGIATTTTGDTTSGSPIITGVANLDGYGPGMYLNPSSGFAAVVSIVDVNYTASTITVSANANATVSGATLTVATPAFASMAVLA